MSASSAGAFVLVAGPVAMRRAVACALGPVVIWNSKQVRSADHRICSSCWAWCGACVLVVWVVWAPLRAFALSGVVRRRL